MGTGRGRGSGGAGSHHSHRETAHGVSAYYRVPTCRYAHIGMRLNSGRFRRLQSRNSVRATAVRKRGNGVGTFPLPFRRDEMLREARGACIYQPWKPTKSIEKGGGWPRKKWERKKRGPHKN